MDSINMPDLIDSSNVKRRRMIDDAEPIVEQKPLAEKLLDLEMEQLVALEELKFSLPVTVVYHPLRYAKEPHADYVRRYCQRSKHVVFIGMNPGPFGMVQTGVPFGDIELVKSWLGISGKIDKPIVEHARRPILGFECNRSEVSGRRFWGLIRSLAADDDPRNFFHHCYVHNYCPAAFMNGSGKNITPPMLKKQDLLNLETVCDGFLRRSIQLLQPSVVVGVGKFAFDKCRKVFGSPASADGEISVRIEQIMHPSPANPATNSGKWPEIVKEQMQRIGILDYVTGRASIATA